MRDPQETRILIIDDELPIREVLSATLRDEGYQVSVAQDGVSGLKAMREFKPHIVFLDIWMPGSMDGLEVLKAAKGEFPDVDFLMISGHGTIETAVKATKWGAWDFIEKPLSMDKILILISNVQHYQAERREKELLLTKLRRSIALIGNAPSIIALKQMVARTAPTPSWVLLVGERGSGRELTAQNIHFLSPRASRPFVEVACSNIPEELVEIELFGFEKGAFAGADRSQKGKFELAQGGTLYLDEVASLPLRVQEKLLRVLQDRKFQPVGGGPVVNIDVRVIAATEKNLEVEVQEGRFREDLYHRLNVVTLQVPPLRERADDVISLVKHFSDLVAKEAGSGTKEFSQKSLELMTHYAWPGNVRELKNFVERVYILTPSEFVDVHDVRFAGLPVGNGAGTQDQLNFRDARAAFEKEYLVKKIAEHHGNISRTAEAIGLERSYLHRKIKTYGIETHRDEDSVEGRT